MRAAHRLAFILSAFVIALTAACDGGPADRPAGIGAAPPTPSPEADMSTGAAAAPRGFQTAGDAATAVGAAVGTAVADSAAPQMLIRTGDASLEVPSLEPAVEAVRQLATRAGGFVASTSYRGGRDQVREASLELRIPADRFEAARQGLDSIGEVEWVNVAVQDVGEEYVDLSARKANSERLETRLVELLATRTGKLEDVLAVERELARVREGIERYEGRLRYLRTRAATSTLTVRLHEPAPVIGGRGGGGAIGEAFRQAWRNFISAVAALIASSGILIPLGVVVAGIWLVARKLQRRSSNSPNPGDSVER